jgi:hypothetical protein
MRFAKCVTDALSGPCRPERVWLQPSGWLALDTPFAPARDATSAKALDATESGYVRDHVRGTRLRGSVVPSLPSTIAAPRASPSVPKGQDFFGLRQEFCLKTQLV